MAAVGMVQMLIEAAEYLERREREAEHGYASMLPYSNSKERDSLKRKNKSKKSSNSRSTHNEMEKTEPSHRQQYQQCEWTASAMLMNSAGLRGDATQLGQRTLLIGQGAPDTLNNA
ncbi:hypothetical protein AAFF_G00424160 [Aldrovandia affinis]|uniref:Uncharacterized protein n=1 Tax=Aldrovandia affinis TaxID=143900 RepID=A0AAD7WZG5_9TELE|nr:hypothetical protein AAFF_G00424160 [Aldrovandia affinis]